MFLILIPIAFSVLFFFYWKEVHSAIVERQRVIKLVDSLPGPYSIPLLGTTWQFKWNMKDLVLQMRSWGLFYSEKGHGLLRLWIGTRPMVIAVRPETAKIVLESTELITKGPEYAILKPWLGTGLLIASGDKWRHRRKMLTPSFHFNVLNGFQAVFDYQSKILLEQIEPFAKSGQIFDAFPYIKRCALDIICETAMGCTVSAQTNHSHPYVVAVREMNILAFKHERMPWLQIPLIAYITGFKSEYNRNLEVVTQFTKKVIEDRMAEFEQYGWVTEGKKAFLDMLIELSKDGGLSYEDIREEVDTFMFEGHDTTAAGMGWALWCFAHNPDCQKKVQAELDEIFSGSNRECTVEDLKKMKYLEKCVKEALRLRPSVPNFSRVVEKDILIDNHLVPKGTSVLVAPQMIHCNPQVYDRIDVFDPERFSEENISKRHPYAYIPFSAGPRNCIGQKFAIQEEKTILSWILRRFEVSAEMGFLENLPLPEIIIRPEHGFPMKFKTRN